MEFYIARRSYDDLVYAVEVNITQKANEMRFQVSEINTCNMFTLMWSIESCTTSQICLVINIHVHVYIVHVHFVIQLVLIVET